MKIEKQKKRLPLGIQNFEELRTGGYHYVDKTDMVWDLANAYKFCFLSRPRRFGKSLLASTLHSYFTGQKDLFQGLKMMELEKEWAKRQVFHFDFSGISTADELESYMNYRLSEFEKKLGLEPEKKTYKDRMLFLMQRAYEQTGEQVAVLVDEYDAPLQNTLFIGNEQEALKTVYRDFFPCFKTGSHLLKCLFLTGIMKFFAEQSVSVGAERTQLSLFSVLNTVVNISFKKEYATMALEERFVFIVKHIFYLCYCELEEERHVAKGRIDLVAHHPKCILVMEMKMDAAGGASAAEEQIADRHYADAYTAEGKPLFTISMEFSTEQRSMTDYEVHQVNP